jgi:hypothetical protein
MFELRCSEFELFCSESAGQPQDQGIGDPVGPEDRCAVERSSPEYPNGSTCWRRLRRWEDGGIWVEAWQQMLAALNHHELLQHRRNR